MANSRLDRQADIKKFKLLSSDSDIAYFMIMVLKYTNLLRRFNDKNYVFEKGIHYLHEFKQFSLTPMPTELDYDEQFGVYGNKTKNIQNTVLQKFISSSINTNIMTMYAGLFKCIDRMTTGRSLSVNIDTLDPISLEYVKSILKLTNFNNTKTISGDNNILYNLETTLYSTMIGSLNGVAKSISYISPFIDKIRTITTSEVLEFKDHVSILRIFIYIICRMTNTSINEIECNFKHVHHRRLDFKISNSTLLCAPISLPVIKSIPEENYQISNDGSEYLIAMEDYFSRLAGLYTRFNEDNVSVINKKLKSPLYTTNAIWG